MCVRGTTFLALLGLVSLPSSRGKACSPAAYVPSRTAGGAGGGSQQC